MAIRRRGDPVGRPSTSVVNRGENGRVMPRPYKNANNSIMFDIPICLESVGCGPVCPPCVMVRPNRADARVCPYGKY